MVEWLTMTSLQSHEKKVKAVHKSQEKMSQFSKQKNVVIGSLTLVWLWHRWGAWRGEALARVQACLQMFVTVPVNSTTCPHAHLQSWLPQSINGDFILCNIKCISYCTSYLHRLWGLRVKQLRLWFGIPPRQFIVTVTRPIIVIWHGYLPRCTGRHYNKTHN